MKKKLSKAGKGRIVSEETRQKSSESHKGQVAWNKGKKTGIIPWNKGMQNVYSEETRKKMGKGRRGKKISELHKKKISEWAKGRKLSEKHRKNLSESKKGRKNPRYGVKISEETRKKLIRIANTPERKQLFREVRSKIKLPSKDTKPELLVQSILKKHRIDFKKHHNFKLSKSYHQADIVIEPNHVIEVFGDYWHFNPKKYDGESIEKQRGKIIMVKEVWKYDKYVIDEMKKQGYKVLVIWESELKTELEKTTEKILKFVSN